MLQAQAQAQAQGQAQGALPGGNLDDGWQQQQQVCEGHGPRPDSSSSFYLAIWQFGSTGNERSANWQFCSTMVQIASWAALKLTFWTNLKSKSQSFFCLWQFTSKATHGCVLWPSCIPR